MDDPNNRDDWEDDTGDAMTHAERGEFAQEDDDAASVYDDADGGCWYCGSTRHFAQSCPQPDRDRNPSMRLGR